MTSQTLHHLFKAVIFVWMMSAIQISDAATATATVSARIIQQNPVVSGLTLSATSVDMSGRKSGEFIIFNQSGMLREVGLQLMTASTNGTPCEIRYSPMVSSIPAEGYQVVRIVVRSPCKEEHRIVINDMQIPGVELFNVPVHAVYN